MITIKTLAKYSCTLAACLFALNSYGSDSLNAFGNGTMAEGSNPVAVHPNQENIPIALGSDTFLKPKKNACENISCPQFMPSCQDGEKLVRVNSPRACCPAYECRKPGSDFLGRKPNCPMQPAVMRNCSNGTVAVSFSKKLPNGCEMTMQVCPEDTCTPPGQSLVPGAVAWPMGGNYGGSDNAGVSSAQ